MKVYLWTAVLFALFLRIISFDFPFFTADEARITSRAFTLSSEGVDELGRRTPLIFNSLNDYQLPVVSYLISLEVLLFGKSQLAVRILFTLIGLGISLLTYLVAQRFVANKGAWYLSAFLIAFSPVIIFLSRVPNEAIVLTLLLLALFYCLTRDRLSWIAVFTISIAILLTSKSAWLTLTPFTTLTLLFFRDDLSKRRILFLSLPSLLLSLFTAGLFLQIPQSTRSFMENNFNLFSEPGVFNAINRFRGQGLESGWPPLLARALFNKLAFLPIGMLHWLANLQPAVLFGQFDSTGRWGLMSMGVWSKATIIPFVAGLFSILKLGDKKILMIFPLILILTYPAAFVYPKLIPPLIVPALPFLAIIIAIGLMTMKRVFQILVVFLIILELAVNLTFIEQDIKNADKIRPSWISAVVSDIITSSHSQSILVSDDIVEDILPFVLLETNLFIAPKFDQKIGKVIVEYPYKYRQIKFGSISLIGFDNKFTTCGREQQFKTFLSLRDFDRIEDGLNKQVLQQYYDRLGQSRVMVVEKGLCIK